MQTEVIKQSKKVIIKQSTRIILYILFLLLITPDIFRLNSFFNYAFYAVRGLAGFLGIVLLFFFKNKSKPLLVLCFYIFYIGVNTFAHGFVKDNIIRYIAIYADIFTIAIFTEYLIREDTNRFIRIMNCIAWLGMIANTVSVFAFPHGFIQMPNEMGSFNSFYFYDYDNRFIVKYIPSILIIFIYEKYICHNNKGGFLTVSYLFVCLLTLLHLRSIACSFAFLLVVIGYFCIDFIPLKIMNFKTIWIGYLIFSFLLIFGLVMTADMDVLTVVGKGNAFLIRMKMWISAIPFIEKSPILGKGILNTSDMRYHFMFAQLHNSLLNLLLFGGIVGLLLYSYFIHSLWEIMNALKSVQKTEFKFFSLLFLSVMTASLFDGLELTSNLYIFYIILGNYYTIANAKDLSLAGEIFNFTRFKYKLKFRH